MQVIALDTNEFYSPFTGRNLMGDDALENAKVEVEFALNWEIPDDLLIGKQQYQELIDKANEIEEDDPEFRRSYEIFFELIEEKYRERTDLVLFHVTSSGMACGPIWETVSFLLTAK